MPKIRTIIFDLDGVLTNTSEYHYRAWKRLVDELDIFFDRQRNEALRGVSRRRSLELMPDSRPVTEEQIQEWMTRKNGYYVEFIQRMTPADILPGVLELLEELRLAGGFWEVGLGPRERVGAAHIVFPSQEGIHLQDILAATNAVAEKHT